MSQLKTNSITHVDNTGDPNIELYADGSTSLRNFQTESINGGQLAGFRNQIINGDFRVWQRNNRSATINSSDKIADRWSVNFTGNSIVADQSIVDGKCRLTVATSGVSEARLEQKIEAQNCRWLINKQVTLTFYTTCNNPKINVSARNGSNTSESITGGYISPVRGSNYLWTWTGTISTSDGEIGNTSNGRGIELVISFDDPSASLPNATYEFWDIQLEPGPVATPFEQIPIGTELALCQRYFYKTSTFASFFNSSGSKNAPLSDAVLFKQTMRASPSIAVSNLSGTATGVGSQGETTDGWYPFGIPDVNPAEGSYCSFDYTADAEL